MLLWVGLLTKFKEMGDIAEQLIDEEMFGSSERYYMPKGNWKRTPSENKIGIIRKEIAIDIKNGMSVNDARKKANIKYGWNWRERGLVRNSDNQWTDDELSKLTYERRAK